MRRAARGADERAREQRVDERLVARRGQQARARGRDERERVARAARDVEPLRGVGGLGAEREVLAHARGREHVVRRERAHDDAARARRAQPERRVPRAVALAARRRAGRRVARDEPEAARARHAAVLEARDDRACTNGRSLARYENVTSGGSCRSMRDSSMSVYAFWSADMFRPSSSRTF